jgi:hypothetical protein
MVGNPKKMAYEIAQGFQQITPPYLRQYSVGDLQIIFFNINFVLREIRAKQVPLEDFESLKDRNVKIHRLHQAINIIQIYSKANKIKI